MPLYTYRCIGCEHQFEARQRMSDNPLTECPVCEGEVRRVINSVGVVFKGSGFYVTDSRNGHAETTDTSKEAPASTTSPSDNDGASDSNNTEKKPAKSEAEKKPAKNEAEKKESTT